MQVFKGGQYDSSPWPDLKLGIDTAEILLILYATDAYHFGPIYFVHI